MKRIDEIAQHAEVSEKMIEHYLICEVALRKGLALKYYNPNSVGFPDRLVILPGRPLVWVELKSKGKKPRKIQRVKHDMLKALGQKIYVVDSKEGVDAMLEEVENGV